ncbi:hypothetical protein GUITHDRAFT_105910 [Guillardia theta CCMP2712]|uniref:PDZ domain-containing protein n=1 Tax=Guillardia theta (strain CCMP2712) TaxID=905079 RepID=L1JIG7_GUITC|nr:hypothetical protein GUITHDRAFT_105910 [Guillardia theta CCMP2712]EKX48303.1 hypothetical protein GUITHDRAFT_105910 [Guillardia theta CCMP2712]|eukprot:XP_005835283.1 hypothetical protein GUITHDRAFT_105910 [Guillardia theta CCMP2712]
MEDCEQAYGIGVQFKVSEGKAVVSYIRADGPSSNLDIAIGDELQSVDGQNIDVSHFDHVAVLIRGSQGTQVRLTLKRDGEKKEVVATRSVQLSTKMYTSRPMLACQVPTEDDEEGSDTRRRLLQSRNPRPLSSLPNNEEYGNTTWMPDSKHDKKKHGSRSMERSEDNDGIDVLKKKCNYLNRENKILTDELASELSVLDTAARKQLLKTLQDEDKNPWSNLLGSIGQKENQNMPTKDHWAQESMSSPTMEAIPWYERVFTCGKRFPDFVVKN